MRLPSGHLSEMIDGSGLRFDELTASEDLNRLAVKFEAMTRSDHAGRAIMRLAVLLDLVPDFGAHPSLRDICRDVRAEGARHLRLMREPLDLVEFSFAGSRIRQTKLTWRADTREERVQRNGGIESLRSDAVSSSIFYEILSQACHIDIERERFDILARAMEGEGCRLDHLQVAADRDVIGPPKSFFVCPAGAEELLRVAFEEIGREDARDLALTIAALVLSQEGAEIESVAVQLGEMS